MGIIFTILCCLYMYFLLEDIYNALKGKKQNTINIVIDKVTLFVFVIYLLQTHCITGILTVKTPHFFKASSLPFW